MKPAYRRARNMIPRRREQGRTRMLALRERFVHAFTSVGDSLLVQAGSLSSILVLSLLLPARGFGIETCLWHWLMGVNCPACGLTRSFIAVAHGRLRRAFRLSPGGPGRVCLIRGLV